MSTIEDKFKIPNRFISTKPNVWEEYNTIALKYNATNLGAGFPDYLPQKDIVKNLEKIAKQDNCFHQYTRDYGHPRLVTILSKMYSTFIGREINPETEILITVGAYEALFSTILGHVDNGDEVIIIEPFFDCYKTMVCLAGGIPKFIPLRLKTNSELMPSSNDWILEREELESLFNFKTKILILNNPLGHFGKVFQFEELKLIADLCKKWNVLCVADEVYEWLVYKPNKHIRIASLPDMWDRTITIGSAGKTFSVTGWRIGWAYGPANLIYNLQMVHQNSVYTGNTPMQEATAICMEEEFDKFDKDSCYFTSFPIDLKKKRDFVVQFLLDCGMKPMIPESGYFVVVDWSSLESLVDLSSEEDSWKNYRFTKWMIKNLRLQAIPLTAFYSENNKKLSENLIRFCFFKKDETLESVAATLKQWKSQI